MQKYTSIFLHNECFNCNNKSHVEPQETCALWLGYYKNVVQCTNTLSLSIALMAWGNRGLHFATKRKPRGPHSYGMRR